MPYIEQRNRVFNLDGLNNKSNTAGELNFIITSLIDEYLLNKGLNYQNINEVIGVLECSKLELYRRIAAPYENEKIRENGDVYSSSNKQEFK